MAQQPTAWPPPRPGGPYPAPGMLVRAPSGLFPSGPPRPTYREPHPVRAGALGAGAGATALWLLLFGLLGTDLASYAWWTLLAGLVAWAVALGLGLAGDRGVAAGVAVVTASGWGIAALVVAVGWVVSGDWPLW